MMAIRQELSEKKTKFPELLKVAKQVVAIYQQLDCGPMPNVMAAQPNIGCACGGGIAV